MKPPILLPGLVLLIGLIAGFSSGCARRMTIVTGTTIGLHATPGDGQSQTPQVTLAYKRAELALIPTGGNSATNDPASDAYSALALIDFRTKWFRGTSIDQFIATGHASREIQEQGDEFATALAGFAKSDSAARLRAWIKTSTDTAERKKRQQELTKWIGERSYNFADLLYDSSLEADRKKFLEEKAQGLGIP